jgi:hypothetical protein
VGNNQILAQIMEEMRPVIERTNQSHIDHAAKVDAELQKEMKAICEKHGVRAQDFAGIGPGPKLLQLWADFLKDGKFDQEWISATFEDGHTSEETRQTPAEVVTGVAGLLEEVGREFPEDSVPATKLRLAMKLLNGLSQDVLNKVWIRHRLPIKS